MTADRLRHYREVAVHDFDEPLRRHAFAERRVNPFMSQNITVITRRWPWVATVAGWSSKSFATRESMYFPKISLIR